MGIKFAIAFLLTIALLSSCGLKVGFKTQSTWSLALEKQSERKLMLMDEDIAYAKSFLDSHEFEIAEQLLTALRKKIEHTERCGSFARLLVQDLNFDINGLLVDIYVARGEHNRARNMRIKKLQNNKQMVSESTSCLRHSSEYYLSDTDEVIPTLQHFAVQQLLN